MSDIESGRGKKRLLVWVVVFLIGIPLLFFLFEYVVPRLLPANF